MQKCLCFIYDKKVLYYIVYIYYVVLLTPKLHFYGMSENAFILWKNVTVNITQAKLMQIANHSYSYSAFFDKDIPYFREIPSQKYTVEMINWASTFSIIKKKL